MDEPLPNLDPGHLAGCTVRAVYSGVEDTPPVLIVATCEDGCPHVSAELERALVLSRGGTIPGVADLAGLTAEDFRPLLHERFVLGEGARSGENGGAVSLEVELVEVTVIPREPGGREPFSLEFQGDPGLTLPQGIYRVEHERLGALEIFLVPIAHGRYEAVFT